MNGAPHSGRLPRTRLKDRIKQIASMSLREHHPSVLSTKAPADLLQWTPQGSSCPTKRTHCACYLSVPACCKLPLISLWFKLSTHLLWLHRVPFRFRCIKMSWRILNTALYYCSGNWEHFGMCTVQWVLPAWGKSLCYQAQSSGDRTHKPHSPLAGLHRVWASWSPYILAACVFSSLFLSKASFGKGSQFKNANTQSRERKREGRCGRSRQCKTETGRRKQRASILVTPSKTPNP